MTTPFWCLFIACALPYVWPGFSFAGRNKLEGGLDNNHPRIQQAKLEPGTAARACAASANAFEALPIFASAVIVNHLAEGDPGVAANLAIAWVVFRVLHGAMYVANIGMARSAMFAFALMCAIGLFLHPVFG